MASQSMKRTYLSVNTSSNEAASSTLMAQASNWLAVAVERR